MSDPSSSGVNCQLYCRRKILRFCIALLPYVFLITDTAYGAPEGKPAEEKAIRNVILFIGDGMGPAQLSLLWLYAKRAHESVFENKTFNLERLTSLAQTSAILSQSAEYLVNDSACAATQYATGGDCVPGVLGIDELGKPSRFTTSVAREKGKVVGLVSDTRITHATPAAFAVHVHDRERETGVAEKLLDSNIELFLSGGLCYFLPRKAHEKKPYLDALKRAGIPSTSCRTDKRDILQTAEDAGYGLAFDRSSLEKFPGGKLLGLFAESGMPNGIIESAERPNPSHTVPSLREMTEASLRILDQNPKGFFLMVEAGQIDWACHMNDAGMLLHEMIRFDDTLGALLDFVQKRDDTLLLVTADHETGGFGFSYNAENIPASRHMDDGAANGSEYQAEYNFVRPQILEELYQQPQSFFDFFEQFQAEPQTPSRLQALVKERLGYEISLEEAKRILAMKPNPYFVKGHKDLGYKNGPDLKERAAFYPDIAHNRAPLLAQVLAARQGIVWSTGTHTQTPVFLFAYGPDKSAEVFKGFMTSRDFGSRVLSKLAN